MSKTYNIDEILAECSTALEDERRRWPRALFEWCQLYGLRSEDLASRLGVSVQTVDSWRNAGKPDPPRFLTFALRHIEAHEEARSWNKNIFRAAQNSA